VIHAQMRSYGGMRYPIPLTPALAIGSASISFAATKQQDSPREPLGPPVKFRDRVKSAVPERDTGRPDLPVIAPDDSPRRVARRLV
jgi:hypothetical protein